MTTAIEFDTLATRRPAPVAHAGAVAGPAPVAAPAPVAGPAPPAWVHAAFYRFLPVADPAVFALRLRRQAEDRQLLGSIVVAAEGVNGAVAGTAAALDAFETGIGELPGLQGLRLQRSACRTPPFGRLKVACRPELVTLGHRMPPVPAPAAMASTRVAPADWRRLIAEPDVVLLDNRNAFEYRLGHFRRAVEPGVQRFQDFPAQLARQAEGWKAAGQRVAMYCTGGIRCEKTAAWMQTLGLAVHQLDGGVLNYFRQVADADRDWTGECFVFDNRIALDTRLQETDTTAEVVYASEPDGAWRLSRARRLDGGA